MWLMSLVFAAEIQADLHLDTPTQMVGKNVGLDAAGLEAGLTELRAGGTNLAVMVLWPPRDGDWGAKVERLLAKVEAEDKRLDAVVLVRTPAEARAAADSGRVGMMVALEGAHGIDKTGIAGLQALYARGLRMLGLTWSMSNRFAGSSGDGGGGLTAEGRALVDEANRLGVILDVSHASEATTLEVCQRSTDPVVASHSNTAAVKAHNRNLSDAAIRCIAERGGVVGVNLHGPFVGSPADVTMLANHIDHLRAVGGIGCVALGSDFDGLIKPITGVTDAGKLPVIWDELRRRGYSEEDLRKIRGENFMRVWDKVAG